MNYKEYKMKKILVITTGGTIACEEGGHGLAPAHDGCELLKDISGCEITVLDLFSCDSTDISPAHWVKLSEAVRSSRGYDGAVVLHGTDTLEYTAAMLYFTASHLGIPVIITGAMLPFSHKYGDGRQNISDAVAVACHSGLKGVYVVFCGRIIGGNEAVKRDSIEKDAFRSFDGKDCGSIKEGRITVIKQAPMPEPMEITREDRKIAVIKLSPFTQELSVPEEYSGTVIEGLGAGGIPDRPVLLKSLRELCGRMTVIITTSCTHGANLTEYEVGQRALECGVTDGGGMSTACAAVKLFLERG